MMHDGFITAMNTQRITRDWVLSISENLANAYTPGYRERKFNFKTNTKNIFKAKKSKIM